MFREQLVAFVVDEAIDKPTESSNGKKLNCGYKEYTCCSNEYIYL